MNIRFTNELIDADRLCSFRFQAVTLADDLVTNFLNSPWLHSAHVVSDSLPIKGLIIAFTDLQHGPQVAMIFSEIVKFIVCEITTCFGGRQYQDLPVCHAFSALAGIGVSEDILLNQVQYFIQEIRL